VEEIPFTRLPPSPDITFWILEIGDGLVNIGGIS
jgi:hypothetical protein